MSGTEAGVGARAADAGTAGSTGTTAGRAAAVTGRTGRVRVLVWHRVDGGAVGDVVAAYDAISQALRGTPGLLGNELLRAPTDPSCLVVASEWESLEAFLAWEGSEGHRPTTAPLRAYRDSRRDPPYEVLQVIRAYDH